VGAGPSIVDAASAELYSADPEGFVARRKELASQARAAGDGAAAKQIAALGKPTKAAWLVNRLVLTDPSVPARLAELGDQLRANANSLDGVSIRKLVAARRELVDALVGQALGPAEQRQTALRDEVADTLNAALADEEVASQVAAGRVLRAAQWAGFGFGAGDPAAAFAASVPAARAAPAKAGRPAPAAAGASKEAAANASASKAERAQAALAEATSAAQAAVAEHRTQQQAVRSVEKQLAGNRSEVADAQQAFQAAQQQLAQAQRALTQASQRQEDAEERLVSSRKLLAEARKDLGEAEARVKQTAAAHRRASHAHDRLTSASPDS